MKEGDVIQSKEKNELKAKVNWCVGAEAGISYIEPEVYKGGSNIINVEEWAVIQESPLPSQTLQQRASEMSVEELRASLENLRSLRARPSKVRSNVGKEVSPSDPLALALTKLTPEQLIKIKAKLGI